MAINPTFNSSLVVFAEKVLQMQLAKKKYFKLCKTGPETVKKTALDELKKIEGEVDTLICDVLYKQEGRRPVMVT